jgi:23S rRNA pseudouridine2605 synthase
MRIQKALAHLGFGSRRSCERMVVDGRVTLDGVLVQVGQSVAEEQFSSLRVDGLPVGGLPGKRYLLLNKPDGYVTTVSDPQGRPTVMDLLPEDSLIGPGRVYPVGRLDRQTLGVLIFTNDGELAHRLLHPSSGVEKEYLAAVDGQIDQTVLQRLRAGPTLDDGPTRPPSVVERRGREIRLVIKEGRKRQVRRMLKEVGLRCTRLERTRFADLGVAGLDRGYCRELTEVEVRGLEALCPN